MTTRQNGTSPVMWLLHRPTGSEIESSSQVDPTRKIKVRYRLVDLAEPAASNTLTGAINPAYDQQLQPRRRDRAASRIQIDGIAQRLEAAALLRTGANWSDGPPLVGPDGMVESGNGRILALRRAIEINPNGYATYRQQLLDRSAEFGLERSQVAAFEQPVLVRERLTEMTNGERVRFVAAANASGVNRMGAAEQARADATLIPPGWLADLQVSDSDRSLDGVLTKTANAPIVARFFNLLPETERPLLMDVHGHLSAAGISRLERAIFAYVMPGRSGERLARLVFENGEAIDRIGAGLKQSLPWLGRLEDMIRAGRRDKKLSIGDDLALVIETMRDIRRKGLDVAEYLQQKNLFGDLTPFQEQLMIQLEIRRRSAAAVFAFIAAYARTAMATAHPEQMRIDDFEISRETTLRTALQAIDSNWIDPHRWTPSSPSPSTQASLPLEEPDPDNNPQPDKPSPKNPLTPVSALKPEQSWIVSYPLPQV